MSQQISRILPSKISSPVTSPSPYEQQDEKHRHKNAKEYQLRGDFLFHCHVEMHMMQGLAGLVASHQSVWLTP